MPGILPPLQPVLCVEQRDGKPDEDRERTRGFYGPAQKQKRPQRTPLSNWL